MNPICKLTPAAAAAAIISPHSTEFIAIGFSHKMCLPARAAATAISR